jgi:uncharacterized protein (DUF2141 family)
MRWYALVAALFVTPAAAAELVVKVENLRSAGGNVRVRVFDSAATWLEGEKALARAVTKATQPSTVVTIEGLKPGTYAVALYHDENGNAKHDRNFLGVPLEGFGFTRNPTVVLSPPSFTECAVEVTEPGAEVSVRLKY